MLIDSLIAKKVWVKSYVTGEIALLPKPMIMKGTIAVAGDFPTTADVLNGWVYKVTANVTDNNPAKTNTGLSFLAGDEICWIEELDTWVDLGSDALFVRDGDTLSPANANDNLDLGSGDFITTGDVDAGTHSELTLAPQATGFTIAGGTTSKTLTVPLDASVSGTNTGDQDLSGLVPYTGATGAVDLGSQTLSSGGETIVKNALGTTSTDGQVITNNTLAIIGTTVQIPARNRSRGNALNTTSGLSETVDCIQELLPVSGTSVSGIYRIGFSINGGAYSYPFTFSSGGALTASEVLIGNASTIAPVGSFNNGYFRVGSSSIGMLADRNIADDKATFVVNNKHASSTGNITNFQWQSVNRLSIQKEGHISAPHADGVKIGIATSEKLGFWNATPVVQQVLSAYTTDNESAAYTGIDNAQAGTVYAQLTDLNALRVAYETLRASYDDLRTKLNTIGIVGV